MTSTHTKQSGRREVSGQTHSTDSIQRAKSVEPAPDIDESSFVGISVSLAGIMIALAALVPTVNNIPWYLKLVLGVPCLIAAVICSYSALWLLAQCLRDKEGKLGRSDRGMIEVQWLLGNKRPIYRPYQLIAIGITILLVVVLVMDIIIATTAV